MMPNRVFICIAILSLLATSTQSFQPPRDLKLIIKTSSSITIGWRNLYSTNQQEIVSGYRISYKTGNGAASIVQPDVLTNYATITGLTPCSTYEIKVAGVDSLTNPTTAAVGPYSIPIFVTTFAPAPTEKISALVATLPNKESALIKITDASNLACPTATTQQCGDYYYRVSLLTDVAKNDVFAVTQVPSFFATFNGLVGGATYTPVVEVIEVVSNSVGPRYTGTAFTMPLTTPLFPAVIFPTVTQLVGPSYTVRWTRMGFVSPNHRVMIYDQCSTTDPQPETEDAGSYSDSLDVTAKIDACSRHNIVVAAIDGANNLGTVSNALLLRTNRDLTKAIKTIAGVSSDPNQIYVKIDDSDRTGCQIEKVFYNLVLTDQAVVLNPPILFQIITNSRDYTIDLASGLSGLLSAGSAGFKITATPVIIDGVVRRTGIIASSASTDLADAVAVSIAVNVKPDPPTIKSVIPLIDNQVYVTWALPANPTAAKYEILVHDLTLDLNLAFDLIEPTLTSASVPLIMTHCSIYSFTIRGINFATGTTNRIAGPQSKKVLMNSPGIKPLPVQAVFLTRPNSTLNTLKIDILDPISESRVSSCDSFQYIITLSNYGSDPTILVSSKQRNTTLFVYDVPWNSIYIAMVEVIGLNSGVSSGIINSNKIDLATRERPSQVTGLATSGITSNGGTLTWSASSIAVPYWIDHYIVTQNSKISGTPLPIKLNSTSLTLNSLFACTDYTFTVEAFSMGNDRSVLGSGYFGSVEMKTIASKKPVKSALLEATGPTSVKLSIIDPGQSCPVIYALSLYENSNSNPVSSTYTRGLSFVFSSLNQDSTYRVIVKVNYPDAITSDAVNSNAVYLPVGNTFESTQTEANITINLNNADGSPRLFSSSMNIPGSISYNNIRNEFCTLIQYALDNSGSKLVADSCQIVSVESGSVKVNSRLLLSRSDSNSAPRTTPEQLKNTVINGVLQTPPSSLAGVGASLDSMPDNIQVSVMSNGFKISFKILSLIFNLGLLVVCPWLMNI